MRCKAILVFSLALPLAAGCEDSGTQQPVLSVHESAEPSEEIADLRAELEVLNEKLERNSQYANRQAIQGWQLEKLQQQIDWQIEQNRLLHAQLEVLWAQVTTAGLLELPARFTDQIYRFGWRSKRFRETVEFEMVLIPGDPEQEIKPFYMSATEVPWQMMHDWAYSLDIHPGESAFLASLGLRPSAAYGDGVPFRWIEDNQPAMAMSYRTAATYCQWLSQQTGRVYRLPTHEEWQHALKLGGGVPEDREVLLEVALLIENARPKEPDPFDPFYDPDDPHGIEDLPEGWRDNLGYMVDIARTAPVGSYKPNALGIYDMLGNAAEWVQPDGQGRRFVVGGHYLLKADELTAEWAAYEDQDVWNATYPQKPPSESWYRDFPVTGLRLVCEPVNIPGDEAE